MCDKPFIVPEKQMSHTSVNIWLYMHISTCTYIQEYIIMTANIYVALTMYTMSNNLQLLSHDQLLYPLHLTDDKTNSVRWSDKLTVTHQEHGTTAEPALEPRPSNSKTFFNGAFSD